MDFLFELIGELLLEGGLEIASNKKISKYIRYPLLIIIFLLFAFIIFGILFIGIYLSKEHVLGGIILIVIGLILLISCIFKIKKDFF